jgi:hypothetical protein
MAMALTAEQRTQVFEILGIPESLAGWVLVDVTGEVGPGSATTDLSAMKDLIDGFLNVLTATKEARVVELLARYAAISASSPLQVRGGAGGARGVLVDHPAERELLRDALSTVIGVVVPQGGFVAEAKRRASGCGTVGR